MRDGRRVHVREKQRRGNNGRLRVLDNELRAGLGRPGQQGERHGVQGIIGDKDDPLRGPVPAHWPQHQPGEPRGRGAHIIRRCLGVAQHVAQLSHGAGDLAAIAQAHDLQRISSEDESEHVVRACRVLDQCRMELFESLRKMLTVERCFYTALTHRRLVDCIDQSTAPPARIRLRRKVHELLQKLLVASCRRRSLDSGSARCLTDRIAQAAGASALGGRECQPRGLRVRLCLRSEQVRQLREYGVLSGQVRGTLLAVELIDRNGFHQVGRGLQRVRSRLRRP